MNVRTETLYEGEDPGYNVTIFILIFPLCSARQTQIDIVSGA